MLIADVGGTKTILGIVLDGVIKYHRRFENSAAAGFDALVRTFLDGLPPAYQRPLMAACIAVAAPVPSGTNVVHLTNRPDWRIDAGTVSRLLGGASVLLINDFAASARGLALLVPADLITLQAGHPDAQGLRLCLGPGTGFGVAALMVGVVVHSEGGHAGFAPSDAEQLELWRFLGGAERRITVEHLCSGPGLCAIYGYCRTRAALPLEPPLTAADVVAHAHQDQDTIARTALALFVRILGAAAGDLALTFLARGGVYLTGGIAPRLVRELQQTDFLAAFNRKASHSALVATLPVHVVLRDDLPLLGCARLVAATFA